jgi:uncharacterized membrane protein
MDKLEPKNNKKPGNIEIIFGILLSVFGMNIYMDFGVLYNIGLILFFNGLILIAFGVKNKIIKTEKANKNENLFVWSLTAIVLIGVGFFIGDKIRATKCPFGGGGNPWCDIDWLVWPFFVPAVGLFIIIIALVNRFTKNA